MSAYLHSVLANWSRCPPRPTIDRRPILGQIANPSKDSVLEVIAWDRSNEIKHFKVDTVWISLVVVRDRCTRLLPSVCRPDAARCLRFSRWNSSFSGWGGGGGNLLPYRSGQLIVYYYLWDGPKGISALGLSSGTRASYMTALNDIII